MDHLRLDTNERKFVQKYSSFPSRGGQHRRSFLLDAFANAMKLLSWTLIRLNSDDLRHLWKKMHDPTLYHMCTHDPYPGNHELTLLHHWVVETQDLHILVEAMIHLKQISGSFASSCCSQNAPYLTKVM